MNNLPRVVARIVPRSESNPRPLSYLSSQKKYKEETKTNKCQCPLIQCTHLCIREGSPEGIRVLYGGKDFCERDEF